jgi:hypothetical protein
MICYGTYFILSLYKIPANSHVLVQVHPTINRMPVRYYRGRESHSPMFTDS